MPYIIVGLGNPGEEYAHTRHNTGRMMLDAIRAEYSKEEFSFNKKSNAQIAVAMIGKEKVTLVAPETFMNNSGKSVATLVKSPKAASKLIVIYDDFNLPLGRIRISFNRSSGGHNGLESVIKSVKTEAFLRIRVGVASPKSDGTAKTPHGDEKIEKFILGEYKPEELKIIKKISKKVIEAVDCIVRDGKDKAMSICNQ